MNSRFPQPVLTEIRRPVIPAQGSAHLFQGWGPKFQPMPAVFTVDPRSGVPMYLQLIEQVKRSVVVGALLPGEQLPTVKQLAVDLTINPNTVARAYRDLERDEVIETSPGRGSFVRANGVTLAARKTLRDVAMDAVDHAVREAKSMGLARDELLTLVNDSLTRWFPEEPGS